MKIVIIHTTGSGGHEVLCQPDLLCWGTRKVGTSIETRSPSTMVSRAHEQSYHMKASRRILGEEGIYSFAPHAPLLLPLLCTSGTWCRPAGGSRALLWCHRLICNCAAEFLTEIETMNMDVAHSARLCLDLKDFKAMSLP